MQVAQATKIRTSVRHCTIGIHNVLLKIHNDLTLGGLHHYVFSYSFPKMTPTSSKLVRPTLTPPMTLP
jgi:hypothetical protein